MALHFLQRHIELIRSETFLEKNKLKIKLAIVAISLSQGLTNAISPVLKQVQEAFPEIPVSTVQFLVTAPSLLMLIVSIAAGYMIVKITKKRLVVTGLLMLAVFGTAPIYLTSFPLIMASRILLGIGTGFMVPLNTAIVAEHFEGRERVATLGIQSASVGAGMLIASALSGTLGMLGYHYSFIVYGMGILSAVAVMFLLPETGLAVPTKTEKIKLNYI